MIFSALFKHSKSPGVSVSLDDVSAMRIPPKSVTAIYGLSQKYGMDFCEFLAVYLLDNNFFPTKSVTPATSEIEQNYMMRYDAVKAGYKQAMLGAYTAFFKNIFTDIKCFPVTCDSDADAQPYVYSDSWGALREYGSAHPHEGTDIIDSDNIRGRLTVVSMTDGVVANYGWNELGGYYVGVRSASGAYFYYAHLDSFADGMANGINVTAGQKLGMMGDTGYSKTVGTKGKFAVHLHLGIQVDATAIAGVKASNKKKEIWIDPYVFLKFIEAGM